MDLWTHGHMHCKDSYTNLVTILKNQRKSVAIYVWNKSMYNYLKPGTVCSV